MPFSLFVVSVADMVVILIYVWEGADLLEKHDWMVNIEQMATSQKVMTLAVIWQGGAWSSPVYYFYWRKSFYFFSITDSRHIKGSQQMDGRAGCSIFADALSFDEIQGIQMQGRIELVKKNREGLAAAVAYLKRFAISHGKVDAMTFIKQQYRASFYRFVPHGLIYMDNRVAMGFKKELEISRQS
jgi:uncharacterized protein YhbP (UPF0306 family)